MSCDLYANVSELLDGGAVAPARPTVGVRSDGVSLFYREQLNIVFGDPESGKTLATQCALVDELCRGGSGIIIDLDHNGAAATISRLINMGADETILRDRARFRYAEPEDSDEMVAIVADTKLWRPTVVIVDSMGELLPLFGASSNSPDDFTRVHRIALKPLVDSGAAVIVIDHLAKNSESQAYGSTGTAAKKRVVGGSSLRVHVVQPFKPGQGGKAQLTINKDRHGGLRAASPSEEREPLAATFRLWEHNGDICWSFDPPANGERAAIAGVSQADIRDLSEMIPPPASQRDVKDRLGWGSSRALNALQEWRRLGSPTTVLPAPLPPVSGAEEHSHPHAPGALPRSTGAANTGVSGIARGAADRQLISVLPAPTHRGTGAEEQSA